MHGVIGTVRGHGVIGTVRGHGVIGTVRGHQGLLTCSFTHKAHKPQKPPPTQGDVTRGPREVWEL